MNVTKGFVRKLINPLFLKTSTNSLFTTNKKNAYDRQAIRYSYKILNISCVFFKNLYNK